MPQIRRGASGPIASVKNSLLLRYTPVQQDLFISLDYLVTPSDGGGGIFRGVSSGGPYIDDGVDTFVEPGSSGEQAWLRVSSYAQSLPLFRLEQAAGAPAEGIQTVEILEGYEYEIRLHVSGLGLTRYTHVLEVFARNVGAGAVTVGPPVTITEVADGLFDGFVSVLEDGNNIVIEVTADTSNYTWWTMTSSVIPNQIPPEPPPS